MSLYININSGHVKFKGTNPKSQLSRDSCKNMLEKVWPYQFYQRLGRPGILSWENRTSARPAIWSLSVRNLEDCS